MKKVQEPAPKVDAIILSGTHMDKRRLIRGLNKAFLPLGDKLSLELVLESLSRAGRVGRIFVVGPEEELRRRVPPGRWGYRIVPEAGRMLDNAWKAYRTADESLSGASSADRASAPYLFLTSDIPLATPEAIDDFVERCFQREADRGAMVDFSRGLPTRWPWPLFIPARPGGESVGPTWSFTGSGCDWPTSSSPAPGESGTWRFCSRASPPAS
jgi:molybdopterin-guanine dinucleotide biosynthesis protein A